MSRERLIKHHFLKDGMKRGVLIGIIALIIIGVVLFLIFRKPAYSPAALEECKGEADYEACLKEEAREEKVLESCDRFKATSEEWKACLEQKEMPPLEEPEFTVIIGESVPA